MLRRALRQAVADRDESEARIRHLIAGLRQGLEVPWVVIGEDLGVSKQAAQRRFRSVRVAVDDRPLPFPGV